MHKEPGERRDFLPNFVGKLHKYGAQVVLEYGYGAELGYKEQDYLEKAPDVRFVTRTEIYQQDYVLVLRCPTEEELRLMHPGACLISMMHYPTRPNRVALLKSLGIEAISLDSIKNDHGVRLVENLRAVGWNGVQAAFEILRKIYPAPGFESPKRPPIRFTLLGGGAVGAHVMQAAIRYGDVNLRHKLASAGVPGVQVTTVDYELTGNPEFMRPLLKQTDILADATQRRDPSKPVVPNEWLAWLPEHAVITDLAVDPYTLDSTPPVVRGIEGIPQGNLDQYVFHPDDPKWENTIPSEIPTTNRRTVVSCYSWPGIHPDACMRHYARQLEPLFQVLFAKGYDDLSLSGDYFERALYRGTLKNWLESKYYRPQPR